MLSKGWPILWQFHLQSLMKLQTVNKSLQWDFAWYVTPRLLTQATALTTCSKAPLSAVTKQQAADEVPLMCDVPSELYLYSSTVPGATVNSRERVTKTLIVMIRTPSVPTRLWGLFRACLVEMFYFPTIYRKAWNFRCDFMWVWNFVHQRNRIV